MNRKRSPAIKRHKLIKIKSGAWNFGNCSTFCFLHFKNVLRVPSGAKEATVFPRGDVFTAETPSLLFIATVIMVNYTDCFLKNSLHIRTNNSVAAWSESSLITDIFLSLLPIYHIFLFFLLFFFFKCSMFSGDALGPEHKMGSSLYLYGGDTDKYIKHVWPISNQVKKKKKTHLTNYIIICSKWKLRPLGSALGQNILGANSMTC